MNKQTIAVGADHAGFEYKEAIVAMLTAEGFHVQDMGTYSADSTDYPDFAHPVAEAVESGVAQLGVLICGSGSGVAMTANKHQGIRCALCWQEVLAALARQHNNANIIALPARFVSLELALQMVRIFITTDFEGGRHARRVGKIACSVA